MTDNPEQNVIDAIDALVDEQMAGGEFTHRTWLPGDPDTCTTCGGAWHGEPWQGVDHRHLGEYDQHSHGRIVGRPGANATGPQRIRFRWRRSTRRAGTLRLHCPGEPYTIADLDMMRGGAGGGPEWVTRIIEQTTAYVADVLGLPVVFWPSGGGGGRDGFTLSAGGGGGQGVIMSGAGGGGNWGDHWQIDDAQLREEGWQHVGYTADAPVSVRGAGGSTPSFGNPLARARQAMRDAWNLVSTLHEEDHIVVDGSIE